jgi:hypothetical protein
MYLFYALIKVINTEYFETKSFMSTESNIKILGGENNQDNNFGTDLIRVRLGSGQELIIDRKSKFYRHFAKEFEENKFKVQTRYQNLEAYLKYCYDNLDGKDVLYPKGVSSKEEALKPVDEENPKTFDLKKSASGEFSVPTKGIDRMTAKSRWNLVRSQLESPEFKRKAEVFLKTIKKDLSSWRELLSSPETFGSFVKNDVLNSSENIPEGVSMPEAFFILNQEILNVEGKQGDKAALEKRKKQYEQFSKYLVMGLNAILTDLKKVYNVQFSPDDAKNKTRLLRHLLLKFISENPLPSDVWGKSAELNTKKPDVQAQAARAPKVLERESKAWQPRNGKIFSQMVEWSKQADVFGTEGSQEDDEAAILAGRASMEAFKKSLQGE